MADAPRGLIFPITVLGEFQTWCEVDFLTPSTRYKVQVAVITNEGTGRFSDTVEFITL